MKNRSSKLILLALMIAAIACATAPMAAPSSTQPEWPPTTTRQVTPPEPIGIIFPRVPGRIGPNQQRATPAEVYDHVFGELTTRPWKTYMIHEPGGWRHDLGTNEWVMSGSQWFPMGKRMQDAYSRAINNALVERSDLKEVWIYGGLYWVHARAFGANRFREQPFADPTNQADVDGMLATVGGWVTACGITGWIFDSGSKKPSWIRAWQEIFQDAFGDDFVVGLEAVPFDGATGNVVWSWAEDTDLHYHALLRYQRGRPFQERVPDGLDAFAWIRREPFPTVQQCRELMDRGWRLAPDKAHDQFVVAAMNPPRKRRQE